MNFYRVKQSYAFVVLRISLASNYFSVLKMRLHHLQGFSLLFHSVLFLAFLHHVFLSADYVSCWGALSDGILYKCFSQISSFAVLVCLTSSLLIVALFRRCIYGPT